jgi:hypothetical protein
MTHDADPFHGFYNPDSYAHLEELAAITKLLRDSLVIDGIYSGGTELTRDRVDGLPIFDRDDPQGGPLYEATIPAEKIEQVIPEALKLLDITDKIVVSYSEPHYLVDTTAGLHKRVNALLVVTIDKPAESPYASETITISEDGEIRRNHEIRERTSLTPLVPISPEGHAGTSPHDNYQVQIAELGFHGITAGEANALALLSLSMSNLV